MYYTVHRQDTGAFVANVVGPLSPLYQTSEYGAVPYEVLPDPDRHDWSPVQRMWVARGDESISVLDFTTVRFTQAERDRIYLAMELHPTPLVRVRLRQLDADLRAVTDNRIRLTDPRTIAGVQYLTTVQYEGTPLLDPARVAAVLALPGAQP
ncbi:MAG: hypothetical protein MUF30_11835 [Burkholderiales bacterium]|jgi:hypothetical protein|nr:hypothetical protein [Burkholderiales bacterium]